MHLNCVLGFQSKKGQENAFTERIVSKIVVVSS